MMEWSQVDGIARRFWTDLVCPDDYFEPCGGWLEQRASTQGQPGDFIVSLNPELHPVGDFVTRCLLRRIEVLHEVLTQFRRRLQGGGEKQVSQAWDTLEESVRALRATCQAGQDALLRESCVILTQTYAAFHPAPDCHWLGLSESIVHRGIPMLKHRLTNRRDKEMPERIAAALGNLRRLYEGGTPQTRDVEEAIAGQGLVVIENPPRVFWEGEAVKADWNKTPSCWKLLLALV